ncbi:nucleotide exchange factor GrpE [Dermatobacter hominis]|uniref:nucleotide exchange factor GrpE n=1 Tax=Dermatobacter hominis TaxID=2884263 RepID=UPI001D10EE82|nr:nucleotide exchange factor GrpE [Dermatobacter hominis]UDY34114.1 nucleotide exchange factor GrpE [Dermatobacter hominis]
MSSNAGAAGYPSDDEVAVGEVVEDDLSTDGLTAEEIADRVDVDLDLAAAGADDLGQSAEEAVVEAVEFAQRVETERDELRDLVQRVKADFDNYKRRVEVQRAEQRALAAVELVRDLLPVLDACDAALAQGHTDVAPVQSQLESTLTKRGLVKVADTDVEFDPNVHEAVMHEEGDGESVVVEVLRAGYLWNDHVVRPAMVKVKG